MYELSARYYDEIYSFKDYVKEAATICGVVDDRCPEAKSLLDVSCGTGKHLEQFKQCYECAGLEYVQEFARIAEERNPGIPIAVGDYRDFDLGRRFDVVTCLFSAIGYAGDEAGLRSAVSCMARHLNPGGLLLIEPWLLPEMFKDCHVAGQYIDKPNLKIARINNSRVVDGVSIFDMHHIVGTPEEVIHFVETHRLTLYTREQYLDAMKAAGLQASYEDIHLAGRGLLVGQAP